MNALHSSNRRLFGAIIIGVLLAASLVSWALFATAPRAERHPPQRQARLVEVQTLQPSNERVRITAYGQVEASQSVALSAQVSGRVVELSPRFVPGQRVRAGEWLLRIDRSDYQVALDNAQANLVAAEAALAQERGSQAVARGDFETLEIEVDEFERALMLREPQLRAAEAKVQSAQAALDQARLNLQRTEVSAPLDALVLSRKVGVGAQVGGSSMVLAELAAAEPFWVQLLVPVEALRWIELPTSDGTTGSEVQLYDVSQPQSPPWAGRVIQLMNAVETEGRRARLLVEVDPQASEGQGNLLLGSYVEARVLGRQLNQVYKLDPAWLSDDRVWSVRDGRLQGLQVEVLHRDDSTVLVSGGLQPGERVVSSLLSSAVDGMLVRTADQSAAPPAAQVAAGGLQ